MNGSNQQAQVVYCSHGGGPLPLLGDPGHQAMIVFMRQLPFQLRRPEAIVVISAHWEEPMATLMGASKPSMLYDYYGFPREAYQITYPAQGAPAGVGGPVLGHRFGGRGPLCPSQQLGGWPGGAAQIRGPLSGRGEDPAATDPRPVARHGHPMQLDPIEVRLGRMINVVGDQQVSLLPVTEEDFRRLAASEVTEQGLVAEARQRINITQQRVRSAGPERL